MSLSNHHSFGMGLPFMDFALLSSSFAACSFKRAYSAIAACF